MVKNLPAHAGAPHHPLMSGAVFAAAPDWVSLFIQDLSQLPWALTLCTGTLTLGPHAPLFLDICKGHSTIHPSQDLRQDANELTPEIREGTGLRLDRQGDGGSPQGARAVLAWHSGVGEPHCHTDNVLDKQAGVCEFSQFPSPLHTYIFPSKCVVPSATKSFCGPTRLALASEMWTEMAVDKF